LSYPYITSPHEIPCLPAFGELTNSSDGIMRSVLYVMYVRTSPASPHLPSPPPLLRFSLPLIVHRNALGRSGIFSSGNAVCSWQWKGVGHSSIGYSSGRGNRWLEAVLWRHARRRFPDHASQIWSSSALPGAPLPRCPAPVAGAVAWEEMDD
jgi:hypothetical protein